MEPQVVVTPRTPPETPPAPFGTKEYEDWFHEYLNYYITKNLIKHTNRDN